MLDRDRISEGLLWYMEYRNISCYIRCPCSYLETIMIHFDVFYFCHYNKTLWCCMFTVNEPLQQLYLSVRLHADLFDLFLTTLFAEDVMVLKLLLGDLVPPKSMFTVCHA